MKSKSASLVASAILITFAASVGAISCDSGVALNYGLNATAYKTPQATLFGTECGPLQRSLVSVASDGVAAIALAAGGAGASAGAGALTSKNPQNATANATANTYIDFRLFKDDLSLADSVFRQISYEVEVITLTSRVGLSGASVATIGGKGFVQFFAVNDLGQMLQASGVPTAHKNGIAAPITAGDAIRFGSDGVGVEVGELYRASFGVTAGVSAIAIQDLAGSGSASAEYSLAISGVITPPEGYVFEFMDVMPAFGAYPDIDAPLSSVPLPGALWLFASSLVALGLRRRRPADLH